MIIKQLIRYENDPTTLEATWTDADGVVIRCHAYHATQMQELRADLGADATECEALIAEAEAAYIPPEPAPPVVPTSVTMRQARLALLGAGLLDSVDAAIAAIPDETARKAAMIEWEFAGEVQRHSGIVSALVPALGLTDEQTDQLFVVAAEL